MRETDGVGTDRCGPVWVRRAPVRDQILKAQPPLDSRQHGGCPYRMQPSDVWMSLESSMENLTWVIVAIGVLVGGLIMMFGFRKTDQKPVAFGQFDRALKQDWKRTGNIDFHASALESSSPQPLRLRVEEKRVTES